MGGRLCKRLYPIFRLLPNRLRALYARPLNRVGGVDNTEDARCLAFICEDHKARGKRPSGTGHQTTDFERHLEWQTMESLFPQEMLCRIERTGIIAVLVIEEPRHAVPTAQALLEGGVDSMELVLRTPAALESLGEICRQVPEMLAGAGTVLTEEQVDQVCEAGAAYAVAPGLNPRTVKRACARNLPFAPGVMTPSDIEAALELGCRELKFFPAEPAGGIQYLTSLHMPYQHLGLRFLPLGGLNTSQLESYLSAPATLAVGGTWLARPEMIAAEDWQTIAQRARQAREIVDLIRQGDH